MGGIKPKVNVKHTLGTKFFESSEAGMVTLALGDLGRYAEDTTFVVCFCESLPF